MPKILCMYVICIYIGTKNFWSYIFILFILFLDKLIVFVFQPTESHNLYFTLFVRRIFNAMPEWIDH